MLSRGKRVDIYPFTLDAGEMIEPQKTRQRCHLRYSLAYVEQLFNRQLANKHVASEMHCPWTMWVSLPRWRTRSINESTGTRMIQ